MNQPLPFQIKAYLRVSTDKQNITSQKLAILEYCRLNQIDLSAQSDIWQEITISSSKSTELRKIDQLIARLRPGDILLVSELSRLGRSTIELLSLVKRITAAGIRLIICKEKFDLSKDNHEDLPNKVILTVFALLADIEKSLIIQRTKEGLVAARARGQILGKPKGTIQPSIYDPYRKKITDCLAKGMNVSNISLYLTVGKPRSLLNYINSRQLKKELKNNHD